MIIEKVSKNDEWEDYYIKSKSSTVTVKTLNTEKKT